MNDLETLAQQLLQLNIQRDDVKAQLKVAKQAASADQRREYRRLWRGEHEEELRAKRRAYYAKNKRRILRQNREYTIANRDKIKARNSRLPCVQEASAEWYAKKAEQIEAKGYRSRLLEDDAFLEDLEYSDLQRLVRIR